MFKRQTAAWLLGYFTGSAAESRCLAGKIDLVAAGYFKLTATGEIDERIKKLKELMAVCRLCPRECEAKRFEGGNRYLCSWRRAENFVCFSSHG